MARLTVWAEIVPDDRSMFGDPRVGRVWKRRPDEHAGRLVKIGLEVPRGFLSVPDVSVEIAIPAEPPFELRGEAEVE